MGFYSLFRETQLSCSVFFSLPFPFVTYATTLHLLCHNRYCARVHTVCMNLIAVWRWGMKFRNSVRCHAISLADLLAQLADFPPYDRRKVSKHVIGSEVGVIYSLV